ncbi:MAG: hypothetical protein HRT90_04360 [Candidatus Margulisbacteria bacterium]|nr:hypothetical protein [Candidatus Margulisiibacteriota bacterium]
MPITPSIDPKNSNLKTGKPSPPSPPGMKEASQAETKKAADDLLSVKEKWFSPASEGGSQKRMGFRSNTLKKIDQALKGNNIKEIEKAIKDHQAKGNNLTWLRQVFRFFVREERPKAVENVLRDLLKDSIEKDMVAALKNEKQMIQDIDKDIPRSLSGDIPTITVLPHVPSSDSDSLLDRFNFEIDQSIEKLPLNKALRTQVKGSLGASISSELVIALIRSVYDASGIGLDGTSNRLGQVRFERESIITTQHLSFTPTRIDDLGDEIDQSTSKDTFEIQVLLVSTFTPSEDGLFKVEPKFYFKPIDTTKLEKIYSKHNKTLDQQKLKRALRLFSPLSDALFSLIPGFVEIDLSDSEIGNIREKQEQHNSNVKTVNSASLSTEQKTVYNAFLEFEKRQLDALEVRFKTDQRMDAGDTISDISLD